MQQKETIKKLVLALNTENYADAERYLQSVVTEKVKKRCKSAMSEIQKLHKKNK